MADIEREYQCRVDTTDRLMVAQREDASDPATIVFCGRRYNRSGTSVERLVSVVLDFNQTQDLIAQLQEIMAGPLGKLAIAASKEVKDGA